MSEPRRSSIARSPGKAGCWSTAMELTYGVTSSGDQAMCGLRASAAISSRMKRARAGPCVATSDSSASRHSAVSTGSMSPSSLARKRVRLWSVISRSSNAPTVGKKRRYGVAQNWREAELIGIKCREYMRAKHFMQLDAVDLRILAELQQDSSLTNVE